MKWKKMYLLPLILFAICLGIHLYSLDAQRVEQQYALGIYQHLSVLQRSIAGIIPFSIGDFLYAIAGLYLVSRMIKYGKKMVRRQFLAGFKRQGLRKSIKIFNLFALLYIVFNLLWGINYNRIGIAQQLHLKMDKYSKEDLESINLLLSQQLNFSKQQLLNQQLPYPTSSELFTQVSEAFQKASLRYPFLQYKKPAVKASLWGWLGNYAGFTGYYNPITGEAQVNTTVPAFTQPFTSCHEVAHQIGYAKEMEANFVGYLAAVESQNPLLLYSSYLDLFLYANRNLYGTDSAKAKTYTATLLPEIKQDIADWRKFASLHRNPVEPLLRWMYGVFLRSNQQPEGILSYSEVTAFMIAYYKKYGKI